MKTALMVRQGQGVLTVGVQNVQRTQQELMQTKTIVRLVRRGNLLWQELLLAVSVQLENTVEAKLNVRTVGLVNIENRTPKESANSVTLGQSEQKTALKDVRHAREPLVRMLINLLVRPAQHGSSKRMDCAHFAQQEQSVQAERHARTVELGSTEKEMQPMYANNATLDMSELRMMRMGASCALGTLEQMTLRAHVESANCGSTH